MAHRITIPAPLDPHTHLRGMEWAHKGDFLSETQAAIAGGYWAVFDMPNTLPSTVDRPALDRKLNEFNAQAVSDWGVYYGAGMDENWHHYSEIVNDVCGLKIYNNSTTGNLLIEDQAVRDQHYAHWPGKAGDYPLPIAVHAEEQTVLEILELVRKYRRFTHFCHISTAFEINALRAAKEEGLPISVGVCPHHLWLTHDDLSTLGAHGLMKPELKTRADRDALWQALQDGVVDVVESDHAPHTLKEKRAEKPPYGVPGLETTLPLLFTAVHEGRLTTEQVIAFVAENPRRIWGIETPPDTYTIVEIDTPYTLDRDMLYTMCGWSPFEGMTLYCRVVETWIRGVQVYDGEDVLTQPGFGINIYG